MYTTKSSRNAKDFLLRLHQIKNDFGAILQSGGRIVSDRYWLTTYIYHQAMGVSVSKNDFKSIVQPDLTVILALNHDVQMERILHRGMSAGDRRFLDKQREIAKAFYQAVLELGIPFVIVDTQRFSPDRCADIVIMALRN